MEATMQSRGLTISVSSSCTFSFSPSSSARASPVICFRAGAIEDSFCGGRVRTSLFTPRWRSRTQNGQLVCPKQCQGRSSRGPTMIIFAQAGEKVDSSGDKPKQTVAITGATGFVGSRLVQRLLAEGHAVRVLTRSADKARSIFPKKNFPEVEIAEQHDWAKSIQGATGVVNLAGTPISRRWTEEIKKEIKASRVNATTRVVQAINAAPQELRPSVFISGTAVGFYGSTSESLPFDESSPSGKDYLAEVCRDWEGKAQDLDSSVRLVRLRTGIVLDKDGGALAQMVPLFRMYAGGPLGSGKQWLSWVHRDDLVSLIIEALSNPAYEGAINGTAPNPVRFSELCDRIGSVLGRPSWLPVPEFALKVILGEGAFVVLEGQRVFPKRAQELGFDFKYQNVSDALEAILA